MENRKMKITPLRSDMPVYSLAAAARILGVHPKTLKNYQDAGLVRPASRAGQTLFSENDIRWTGCLRSLIHDKKFGIPGLRKLLQVVPCWEAADCSAGRCGGCSVQVDWSAPRSLRLHQDGQPAAEPRIAAARVREGNSIHCLK
ncbi:MAG: MerR family transcriptional regulator [Pseudomonadota bacterium]